MLLPFRRGRRAEILAVRHLRRQGLRILARNVRAGRDEIDILALEGKTAVVVEVRMRRAGVMAADLSVDPAKARRVRRAWSSLRRRLALSHAVPVRFDLVVIGPEMVPVHVRGALDGSSG
jgi:putative endonuclease